MQSKFIIESFDTHHLKDANHVLDLAIDKLYIVHITEELKTKKIEKCIFCYKIKKIFQWIVKYNNAATISEI